MTSHRQEERARDLKITSRTDNGLHFGKIQVEIYLIKGNSELLKGLCAV